MNILTNSEFDTLVQGQAQRLKAIAKDKKDAEPKGWFTLANLDEIIKLCGYTGEDEAVKWLKNLKSMATSGKLSELKSGANTFKTHALHVTNLCKTGKIAFDIGDSIMMKDTGKLGTIADYNHLTEEYVVVLNPFQVQSYPKGELEKVGKKVD